MQQPLTVVKFGGTSLASPARMRRAARRVVSLARDRSVVVVVSATGSTTDRALDWIGRTVGPGWRSTRETDRALSTGESFAAAAMAVTLEGAGLAAVSLGAGEAGIRARGRYGDGVVDCVDSHGIRHEVHAGRTPVVAGFQALRADGEVVTLGRGGSDVTAVELAVALDADACHLVTDVACVFDRDPALDPAAVPLPCLTHDQLCEVVENPPHGVPVIHPRAARVAAEHRMRLWIYDFRAGFRKPGGSIVGTTETAGRVA